MKCSASEEQRKMEVENLKKSLNELMYLVLIINREEKELLLNERTNIGSQYDNKLKEIEELKKLIVTKDDKLTDNEKKIEDLDKEIQRLREEHIKEKYNIVKDFEDKVNSLTSTNKSLIDQLSATKNFSITLSNLESSLRAKEEELKAQKLNAERKQLELNEVNGLLSKAMEDIEKLEAKLRTVLLRSESLEADAKKK